jgi:hypothetical protein
MFPHPNRSLLPTPQAPLPGPLCRVAKNNSGAASSSTTPSHVPDALFAATSPALDGRTATDPGWVRAVVAGRPPAARRLLSQSKSLESAGAAGDPGLRKRVDESFATLIRAPRAALRIVGAPVRVAHIELIGTAIADFDAVVGTVAIAIARPTAVAVRAAAEQNSIRLAAGL